MRLTLLPALTWIALLGGARVASASDLQYFGGPVAHSMNVILVQWGSSVRSTYTDTTAGDPAFFTYLAGQSGSTADIGGVLAQYMDTTGNNSQNRSTYGGSVQITPPHGSTVQDSTIQSQLQSNITSATLPAPAGSGLSTIYVVLLPPSTNVCLDGTCSNSPNGFCAYHNSFQLLGATTQVLYAAMVDNGPGSANFGFCGSASTDIQNQTAVVSHEFAETVNDPLVGEDTGSTITAPIAWYDPVFNGEIADKCDTLQAANGPWTVEPLWSNLNDGCEPNESAYLAPTASFFAPSTGALSVPVSFDGSGSTDPAPNHTSASFSGTTYSISSGISSYAWNWGDGGPVTTGTTPAATHAYESPGTYQVSLTCTDDLGFTSTATEPITISPTGGTPAVRTDPAGAVGDLGATLNGTINAEDQTGQYRFMWGSSPDSLDQSTPPTALPIGETTTPVSATLSGLLPSTTYYYALAASVAGGQPVDGAVRNFTTSAAPAPPPPQTPTAATGGAAQVTTTSALLAGTVDPGGTQPVTYQFLYGSTPSNLSRTTPQATEPGGTVSLPVSAPIAGLAPASTYYFRLDVSLGGQTYSGAVQGFTTLTPAPDATTGAASRVTSSGATVSGTVNPQGAPTAYLVEYGTTTSYGHSSASLSAGSGTSSVPVTVALAGLKANTTYHYRVIASSDGGTAIGADHSFKTARAQAASPRFRFRIRSRPVLAAALAAGLKMSFSCSKACAARFTATSVPGRIRQTAPATLTLASGSKRIRTAGTGTAILKFSATVRRRLHATRSVSLLVTGYAIGTGTQASPSQTTRITLR